MRKYVRIIYCALILCVAAALTGCGGNGPAVQAISPAPGIAAEPAAGQSAGSRPAAAAERAPGFSEKDIAVDIDGFSAKLGANIKDVLAKLGDGYDYSEAISCAYDGMDKTYIYPGVEFYTYPDGDRDLLFEVTLTDGGYATAAGLRVGCGEKEIRAVYGEKCFQEGLVLRYNVSNDPDNMDEPSLYFVIEGGKATSIGISLGEREI